MKWLLALLIPVVVEAQTATLSGLVQDAAQTPVAGASVMLWQMETGTERTARSNGKGIYSAASLVPGRYKITVEAQGFQVRTVENVELAPAQKARLDFRLVSGVQTQPQFDFSSEVKEVSLLAAVRDQSGRVVKNLTQDDFVLLDDGVPQRIRYFAYQADLPLKLGLLVDTSWSEAGRLDSERRAAFTFLDRMLRRATDRAFIARFDERVTVLTGLTSSRQELSAALDQLRLPPGYGTLIFTAIRDSAKNVMQQEDGRKAMIVLTDGVDHFDHTSIGTAIEFAQRADCILYPIHFFEGFPLADPVGIGLWRVRLEKGKKGLERMALETGGDEFEVSKRSTIEDIYTRIEEALRNQYSIGYTPDPVGQPGKYHKIRLSTKDPHLVVRSRSGYYGDDRRTAKPAAGEIAK